MMYCVDCGIAFGKPKTFTEYHGLDTPPYEKFIGCPSCGSTWILKAIWCSSCDKYITQSCVKTKDGNYYCKDCYSYYDPSDDIDIEDEEC